MQIIKTLTSSLLFLIPAISFAQSTYLLPGSKDYLFVDRLEIKSSNLNLNLSSDKPYNRRRIVTEVEALDSLYQENSYKAPRLTPIDRYNLERFLMNNSEWAQPREAFKSRKPVFNTLYKNKGNMIEVNNEHFFLAVNPLFTYQQTFERGNSQNLFYNSRGFALRGLIDRKIGFHIYLTENQERMPTYGQQYVFDSALNSIGYNSPIVNRRAVPGVGFYKTFKKTGVDYFDVRGSISFNVTKFIDMQFGYDKHFIGSGFRSLFISDFTNNATFLKINTRIWKFNYQNLYKELVPSYGRLSGGDQLPRKYFRMNHLTMNIGKTATVGIFDAVVFGRKDHFDFQYLLPVMFLRPAEQQVGSSDNAVMGLDAKVNIFKTFQVYGQLMFDEFKLSELKGNRGWWANKYGYQLGAKYIDVFGVRNLDVQLEMNRVRPFTYSHFDSVANYSHYNQPLAHPLGANFQEYVAIVRGQPYKKVYLEAKMIYYKQGLDIGSINFGNNIFRDYDDRSADYGYAVGSGDLAKCLNMNFLASYEIRENLFFDISGQVRNYSQASGRKLNNQIFSTGIRWNMARRNLDF